MKRWPERLAPPVFPSETAAMCFWQSRAGMRHPPQLADLGGLARSLRRSWPTVRHEVPDAGAQEMANGAGDQYS